MNSWVMRTMLNSTDRKIIEKQSNGNTIKFGLTRASPVRNKGAQDVLKTPNMKALQKLVLRTNFRIRWTQSYMAFFKF